MKTEVKTFKLDKITCPYCLKPNFEATMSPIGLTFKGFIRKKLMIVFGCPNCLKTLLKEPKMIEG